MLKVATGAAADIVAEAETDQTGTKARPIVQQGENSASTKPADEAAAESQTLLQVHKHKTLQNLKQLI